VIFVCHVYVYIVIHTSLFSCFFPFFFFLFCRVFATQNSADLRAPPSPPVTVILFCQAHVSIVIHTRHLFCFFFFSSVLTTQKGADLRVPLSLPVIIILFCHTCLFFHTYVSFVTHSNLFFCFCTFFLRGFVNQRGADLRAPLSWPVIIIFF